MDISSLRERSTPSELTVSELNLYVKRMFENDRTMSAVSVRGEISNFTYHRSGHLYFSLKDEEGQVKAVMFRSSASNLKFLPENGMKVIVRCSVNVYVQGGAYQLYVTSMQPDGIGALYLAYEQLKAKLENEGLFSYEYKKNIPLYPSKIGVITSPTGAAVRDIINVTSRRYPLADIYLYPSLVQGEGAEENLIEALDYFDKSKLADVIIIGRGGGSIEDLWAFNSERLARKIFECSIPIISAVGHETDFTICDFVADLRAPTPSAAAEIAVPDYKDLLLRIDSLLDRCAISLKRICERKEEKINNLKDNVLNKLSISLFENREEEIDSLKNRLKNGFDRTIVFKEGVLKVKAGQINALSPLATLSRGYSIVSSGNSVVKKTSDVKNGEVVKIRVSDGEIYAEIKDKKEY